MTAVIESIPDMNQEEQPASPPLFFPVSLPKLAVMSVCTLGLYEFFWLYRNWRLIKAREEPEAEPVWNIIFSGLRAIVFPVFFCYSLFIRVQEVADEEEVPISLAPGFLASGWILSTLLVRLPEAYWMLSFLTIIFLLPVQSAVNSINKAVNPELDPNRHFSWWNISTIIAGVILIVLALTGTTLLSESIDTIGSND